MCAATAAARGLRVVVAEHADRPGKKIAISGGGRCNFTNLHTTAANFLSDNPDFCRSALARYTPADFVALVERHGIAWHEKKLGQLFCDDSARDIVALLLAECEEGGAEVLTGCRVVGVERGESGSASASASAPASAPAAGFVVETSRGVFDARSVVVATGGLSVPPLGATDLGYRLASQFGLRIVAPRAALVPLTFGAGNLDEFKALAGVSLEAAVEAGKARFVENILFTHRGISGPAVLQISSYWKPGSEITLDLLPHGDAAALLREHRASRQELQNLLSMVFPRRFAVAWAETYGANKPVCQFSPGQLTALVEALHHWRLLPDGTEGYRTAEVTAGGVDTAELSSKTMEARRVPGLYFIGEVVDVTGHLGGFNFQWAWASGQAAGQAAGAA